MDILTDGDGDGVGDVNERIAGTNAADPVSTPQESTVDVLWLHDDGVPHGAQYARIHHFKAVANAIFRDSGTNIRLRTVGVRRIEKADPYGWADQDHVLQMMDLLGADVTYQTGHSLIPCAPGCAGVRGSRQRGYWSLGQAFSTFKASAQIVAHELGHVMGLVHSAKQGETQGAFLWSRGHYLSWRDESPRPLQHGTVMSYGSSNRISVFSDPAAACLEEPCGVPIAQVDGADARTSLDLLRFQVAAHRDAKPDSDGDGFVDDADIAPADPAEWMDSDADGIGDNADPDDDGDGVNDTEDRWPLDPIEWEDLDGDGVGDNADDDVEIEGTLDPFADAALRRAVERALEKSPGEAISAEEMAGLENLQAFGLGIRSLAGLELATGLVSLDLHGNEVTDLSPLAGLTSLERLSLDYNFATDLSPLSDLTSLADLSIGINLISDLSPLAGLANLNRLDVSWNQFVDVSPLAALKRLEFLELSGNRIVAPSPLSELTGLTELRLFRSGISDAAFLSALSGLQQLALDENDVSDLTPLSGLQALRELLLTNNRITDVTPLQGLSQLQRLHLGANRVSDLSPISGLTSLQELRLGTNSVSDLAPLAALTELRQLWVGSNEVSDLSPIAELALVDLDVGRTNVTLDDVAALPGFLNLRSLGVAGLGISDVRPIAALTQVRKLWLDENSITNISPLAVREIWSDGYSELHLQENPLDEASVAEHVPLLMSWSVVVHHEESPAVDMPDPRLRRLVVQETAYSRTLADVVYLTRRRMGWLSYLRAYNAGISDLTGLEAAINLRSADLSSNYVSDLAPLSKLDNLIDLNLKDNLVSEVSPLVGMDALRDVNLSGNPLTEESLNDHIPNLRADGVSVDVESVEWEIPAGSETARFEVKRYFESLHGPDFNIEAVGDNSGLASVDVIDGVLEVSPHRDSGVLTATVTATNGAGTSVTLRFRIAMTFAADDHGNDRESATDLAIGARIEAQIDFKGDRDWFRLELSEPASVVIYTTGDLDTVGQLHDEYGAVIVSDDDGGADANFHIEGDRAAGVYYVRVDSDGGGTGNYTFHARRYVDVALPKTRWETVRLWMTPDGGWTLDPETNAPFLSGGKVASAWIIGDAYVLRLGSDGAWSASPSAGVCKADLWTLAEFAGTGLKGHSGDGGPATNAQLHDPYGVAMDAVGNVYVADLSDHRIRRIAPDGVVETFAGTGVAGFGGDGGAAVEAQLNGPRDVAVDAAGNVYVVDWGNHRIRRIAPDGMIETLAGTGVAGFGGDGGPAVEAQLNGPRSVAVDAAGNVYLADGWNYRIRRIAPDGTIKTFAGTGEYGFSGDGGPASQAQIAVPSALAVDAGGRLYFVDGGKSRIRRIGPDGMIETIAGGGDRPSASGWPAQATRLDGLEGLAVDSAGYVYFAAGQRLWGITPEGMIETLWDLAFRSLIVGTGDNPPDYPGAIAVDASGQHVYFAVLSNHRVRVLMRSDDHGDEAMCATSLALGAPAPGRIEADDDADWFRLELGDPASVAIYTTGNLNTFGSLRNDSDAEIASDDDGGGDTNFHIEGDRQAGVYYLRVDSSVNTTGAYTLHARRYEDVSLGDTGETVRLWGTASGGWTLDRDTDAPFASGGEVAASDGARFVLTLSSAGVWTTDPAIVSCNASLAGVISTLGGKAGLAGYSGDGGLAVDALLNFPFDVAVDTGGYVYVAERLGHRIRRIGPGGIIETFAGTGVAGFGGDGGPATEAQLNHPAGLTVDAAGNVYVADADNHRVRRIGLGGRIETFAGTGVAGFGGDGGPATEAQLNHPAGLTVDAAGNVYVADTDNHRVRRIGLGGRIETFAGTGARGYDGDGGPATEHRLNHPFDVAADASGSVYVADVSNRRIRRIAQDGTIETFAGTGTAGDSGDGGAATDAQIDQPAGLAVSSAGYVFVADWGKHRVRRIAPDGTIETYAGTGVYGSGGDGGLAIEAQLVRPSGVAVDAMGKVYIADSNTHRVRVVEMSGPCRVHLLALPDRELGLGSGPLKIDLDEALGEQGVSSTYEAVSSDDSVAAVRIQDGLLFVEPRADGTVTVTVTATAGDGTQTVHSFDMRVVSRSREVPYLLAAGDERRQGLVRVINHSEQPGEVSIEAFDEAGTAYGPLTMPIAASGTLHFTSADLERGNAGAGLPGGVGTGQGGWRLALDSERDIEVLSYIRTADGFLTAMHDVAPEDEDGVYRVAIFYPGSDTDRVSVLRLVNPGEDDATVTIRGIDEDGMSPGSDVQVSVPAGQARSFRAADLEAGTGVTGALGDGAGKWRLDVLSNVAIHAMNLLESPGGYLSNVSTVPVADGSTWIVPLLPSASDALQRQGLVRVINRGDATAEVSVQAFDESVRDYDPLTLRVDGGKTVNLDSNDLEMGNAVKGLSGSTGAGIGDWWLKLASESDIEVLSYIGTPDGFFTSVHDAAPSVENRHRVVTFNPGRDVDRTSRLRLINAGAGAARVTIRGVDDDGQPSDEVVRTSVPGHSVRTYTAVDLELGAVELEGALGTGVGKWRLSVESDRPIAVMSLLDSPTTGRLTNLSTVPQGRARSRMLEEGDGGGGIVQTAYSVNDLLPGVPSSGVFTPTIQGGGSILITGNDTTISLDDGAYFELDDGTRYTCTTGDGCAITNGTVTAGTVVGRAAGAGEVDRFPTFRTATAPGERSYTVGEAIDALTLPEASGGNGELAYGLSPEVPGLSFNAATRQVTGTPSTAGSYAMTYSVTDEDGDTDTLRFTITVSGGSSTEGSLGVCQVGMTLSSGQSCTYPGTTDEFSVNARGRGSFLGRLAGIRIRIDNETINGRVYDFLASHRGEGVWRIDRIAGRTEPPTGAGTDTSPSFAAGSGPGNKTYTVGTAIDTLTLQAASGGNGTLSYTLSPEVSGLTFDATARQLSGTPDTAASYNPIG